MSNQNTTIARLNAPLLLTIRNIQNIMQFVKTVLIVTRNLQVEKNIVLPFANTRTILFQKKW